MTFTKRSDVAMFLVAQGFPVNKVKAAVDQGYNFEADGDSRDLCWRANYEEDFVPNLEATKPGDTDDECQPALVDDVDAMAMYNTYNEMMKITDAGIEIDGELMYDLNGDRLPSKPVLTAWVAMPVSTPPITTVEMPTKLSRALSGLAREMVKRYAKARKEDEFANAKAFFDMDLEGDMGEMLYQAFELAVTEDDDNVLG